MTGLFFTGDYAKFKCKWGSRSKSKYGGTNLNSFGLGYSMSVLA